MPDKTKIVELLRKVLKEQEYLFEDESKVTLAELITVAACIRSKQGVLKRLNGRQAWQSFISKSTGLRPDTAGFAVRVLIKLGILAETDPKKAEELRSRLAQSIPNPDELFETAKFAYTCFPTKIKLRRGAITCIEPATEKKKDLDGWNHQIREYVTQNKGIELSGGVSDEEHVKKLNELLDPVGGGLVVKRLGPIKLSTFRTKVAKLIKYGYLISYRRD